MTTSVAIDASLIESQLSRAQSNVRTLDEKFRSLAGGRANAAGRTLPPSVPGAAAYWQETDRPTGRRASDIGGVGSGVSSRPLSSRLGPALSGPAFPRIRLGPPAPLAGAYKRSLTDSYGDDDAYGDYGKRYRQAAGGTADQPMTHAHDTLQAPSVASAVIMPTIETKSRDEAMREQSGHEPKEVAKRNRRMFATLLGTLSAGANQRQARQTKLREQEHKQQCKQRAVESRLEHEKHEEREAMRRQRDDILTQKRMHISEINTLQKKRNLIQFAERDEQHMRLLSHYIRTSAKPAIFYVPAKHTLRTLELHKKTKGTVEAQIDDRRAVLQRELAHIDAAAASRQQQQHGRDGRRQEEAIGDMPPHMADGGRRAALALGARPPRRRSRSRSQSAEREPGAAAAAARRDSSSHSRRAEPTDSGEREPGEIGAPDDHDDERSVDGGAPPPPQGDEHDVQEPAQDDARGDDDAAGQQEAEIAKVNGDSDRDDTKSEQ